MMSTAVIQTNPPARATDRSQTVRPRPDEPSHSGQPVSFDVVLAGLTYAPSPELNLNTHASADQVFDDPHQAQSERRHDPFTETRAALKDQQDSRPSTAQAAREPIVTDKAVGAGTRQAATAEPEALARPHGRESAEAQATSAKQGSGHSADSARAMPPASTGPKQTQTMQPTQVNNAGRTAAEPPAIATASQAAQVQGTAAARAEGSGAARQLAQWLSQPTDSARPADATNASGTSTGQAASEKSHAPRSSQAPAQSAGEAKSTESSAFDRIVRAIRIQGGPRMSSAQVELNPPALGRIRVNMAMRADQLQLEVLTQTQEARDMLGERIDKLRHTLAEHGIHVDRCELKVAEPAEVQSNERSAFADAQDDSRESQRDQAEAGEQADHGDRISAQELESFGAGQAEATVLVANERIDIRA